MKRVSPPGDLDCKPTRKVNWNKKELESSSAKKRDSSSAKKNKSGVKESQSDIYDREILINALASYDKLKLNKNMVWFRDMFFKNFLKDPNEQKMLKNVFMTSFGFETELLSSVITNTEKFLLLNDSSNGSFELHEAFGGHNHFTVVFPSKQQIGYGYGAFHPKLWLIEFKDKTLRVVIGSGNLSIGDWTVWSNSLWYTDFPQKTYASQIANKEKPKFKDYKFFAEYLTDFIEKSFPKGIQNLQKYGGISLSNFDFDSVEIRPWIIPSVPGRHLIDEKGASNLVYGLERLKEVMINNPYLSKVDVLKKRITYQSSSIGQLSWAFLVKFIDWVLPGHKTFLNNDQLGKIFNVMFPSENHINSSKFKDFANWLFLNSNSYNKAGFVRGALSVFEPNKTYEGHKGIIPHLKVMIITDDTYEINNETVIYMGSHNFTASAWGKYNRDETKIEISNTELGILYPPGLGTAAMKKKIVEGLPFNFPPRKFDVNEKPFFNDFFKK